VDGISECRFACMFLYGAKLRVVGC
jgi:hypothetical protein